MHPIGTLLYPLVSITSLHLETAPNATIGTGAATEGGIEVDRLGTPRAVVLETITDMGIGMRGEGEIVKANGEMMQEEIQETTEIVRVRDLGKEIGGGRTAGVRGERRIGSVLRTRTTETTMGEEIEILRRGSRRI